MTGSKTKRDSPEREDWLKDVMPGLSKGPAPGQSQHRLIRELRDIVLRGGDGRPDNKR